MATRARATARTEARIGQAADTRKDRRSFASRPNAVVLAHPERRHSIMLAKTDSAVDPNPPRSAERIPKTPTRLQHKQQSGD